MMDCVFQTRHGHSVGSAASALLFVLAVWVLFFRAYRAGRRLSTLRCPHCSERFFYTKAGWIFGYENLWSNRRVHCGNLTWASPALDITVRRLSAPNKHERREPTNLHRCATGNPAAIGARGPGRPSDATSLRPRQAPVGPAIRTCACQCDPTPSDETARLQ